MLSNDTNFFFLVRAYSYYGIGGHRCLLLATDCPTCGTPCKIMEWMNVHLHQHLLTYF